MTPQEVHSPTESRMARIKNIVISGTNFWNPGDDFVRDGVIRVLREVFPGELLNFLFYNFNADFFPQSKFSGLADYVLEGDLEKYREDIDAVVIVGLPVGDEMKDLYCWILASGLEENVYIVGAGYESNYICHYISQEPEATIFRKARIVTGRTAKRPDFFAAEGIAYQHINCPAILSVPAVKHVPAGRKIQRIGFSIQLPHGEGIPNHSCAPEMYDLSVDLLRELARDYAVEVLAHHKTEYFHFLKLLRGTGIPVIFSSFYRDLFEIYPRYDLVITTRLHASLFANGHGIPGIIINDTDRHTHTLEGFLHSTWVNSRANFDKAFAYWLQADLAAIPREAEQFKTDLLARYINALCPVLSTGSRPKPKTPAAPREFNPMLLSRRVEYGQGVHLQEGSNRWLATRGEIRLPNNHLPQPVELSFVLSAGDLWCYKKQAFQTVVNLDGKPHDRLVFDRNGQQFEVSILLEPKPEPQVLTIESSASFVPALIDQNSRDERCLAVKCSEFSFAVLPATTAPALLSEPATNPSGSEPAPVQKPVPSTLVPERDFLWSPTRNELISTKFMRNRVLFSTLANVLLPELRRRKNAPLKILFWACSIGCEPYSMRFLLGPDSADEIVGIDFDAEAIVKARSGFYNPATWTMFFEDQKTLLTDEEINRFFERFNTSSEDQFRVAKPYRHNISFLAGDLFAALPVVPFKMFDVVICNNLLIHLKPHAASAAWGCLQRYMTDTGLLVVGGCNPSVRREAALRLALEPCPTAIKEISESWCGVSGAWNFNPRPAWAYPAPDEKSPDYPFLAGEIFKKATHQSGVNNA